MDIYFAKVADIVKDRYEWVTDNTNIFNITTKVMFSFDFHLISYFRFKVICSFFWNKVTRFDI